MRDESQILTTALFKRVFAAPSKAPQNRLKTSFSTLDSSQIICIKETIERRVKSSEESPLFGYFIAVCGNLAQLPVFTFFSFIHCLSIGKSFEAWEIFLETGGFENLDAGENRFMLRFARCRTIRFSINYFFRRYRTRN